MGDGGGVGVSSWHVGGTHGSGVSSGADVIGMSVVSGMSVVRGMRGASASHPAGPHGRLAQKQ